MRLDLKACNLSNHTQATLSSLIADWFMFASLNGLISNRAKLVVHNFPILAANAGQAPEHIVWINLSFDLEQSIVITSPECLLEVGLVRIGLNEVSLLNRCIYLFYLTSFK
jgi:hypothetical protein